MKNVMIMVMMFLFIIGCGSESNSDSAENYSEDINTVSEKDSIVAFLNSVSDDKKDTVDSDTLIGNDFTVVMNTIAVKSQAPEGEHIVADTVFVIDTVIVYDTIYVDTKTRTEETKETREESPSKIDTLEIDDSNDGKDDSGELVEVTTVEVEVCDSFCVETDSIAISVSPALEGGDL